MIPDTFSPFKVTTPARARGCWTCTFNHGNFFCGHVLCERTKAVHVIGVPRDGCAFWEREPLCRASAFVEARSAACDDLALYGSREVSLCSRTIRALFSARR